MSAPPPVLLHATSEEYLPAILAAGLDPDECDLGVVHLSERDYRETITSLHGLGPGGMREHETGRMHRAVLLLVRTHGLPLAPDGLDGEDHWTCAERIGPERIQVVPCERCGLPWPNHSRECANADRAEYPAVGPVSEGLGELRGGDVQALPREVRESKRPRAITRHDQRTPLPGDPGWDTFARTRERHRWCPECVERLDLDGVCPACGKVRP